MSCGHAICSSFVAIGQNIEKGVSVVVHDGSNIIVGKVGLGWKFGSLTTCSGKFDKEHDTCCIATAIRELEEEFKIKATTARFESAALVSGAIVLLFNCHGHDLAKMQSDVALDHQMARRVINLTDDDACRKLKWQPDEPLAVSKAAAEGEMQSLISIPYDQISATKEILKHCVTHIHAMMQWRLLRVAIRDTFIVWSN